MLDKKFRAWNKQLKRFIYFETWWGLGSYGDDSDCYDDIQQFTGLTDKNTGEEIYEGDIIKFSGPRFKEGTIPYQDFINKEKKVKTYTSQISFDEWGFNANFGGSKINIMILWFGDFWEIEVIGNIYENPKLPYIIEDEKVRLTAAISKKNTLRVFKVCTDHIPKAFKK